jgi:hypothetical protein
MLKTITAFLLLALPLQADVKAIIEGPTTANTGDLVVLTTGGSIGDNFVWIMPDSIQTITCDADKQVAFASGKPGVFKFTLIAADITASIAYTQHTVTIGTPTTPPENGPPDGPTPAPDLSKLTELSLANTPPDPNTQAVLRQSIHQVHTNIVTQCNAGACPSLAEAQVLYQTAITQALLTRPRGSQTNWIGWRKAIEAAIVQLKPTTIQDLQNIMLAIYP